MRMELNLPDFVEEDVVRGCGSCLEHLRLVSWKRKVRSSLDGKVEEIFVIYEAQCLNCLRLYAKAFPVKREVK